MSGPFFPSSVLRNGEIPHVENHVHTTLTDGRSTAEEYLHHICEKNMEHFAFTEHADDRSGWLDNSYLSFKEKWQALAGDTRLWLAAEVKLMRPNGMLALSEDACSRPDFIVGVLHRYPDKQGGFYRFDELSKIQAQELDYHLSMALIKNPLVDVWGHPGGMFALYFDQYDPGLLDDLIETAISNNKVIELNTNKRYARIIPMIFERCMEHDCMLSIGSDAHHVSEVGTAFRQIQQLTQVTLCE